MTAAAEDPEIAVGPADGVDLLGVFIRAIPIRTPFGDIAMQVVEPPWIGRLTGDAEVLGVVALGVFFGQLLVGEIEALAPTVAEPILVAFRQAITEGVEGRRAGSAGVFPFGFGGQSVSLPLLLAQPGAKLLCAGPTDAVEGVVRFSDFGSELRLHRPPLGQRGLGARHTEWLGECDLVGRGLVPVRLGELSRMLALLVVRTGAVLAHDEGASRDLHEFHADGVADDFRFRCGGGQGE